MTVRNGSCPAEWGSSVDRGRLPQVAQGDHVGDVRKLLAKERYDDAVEAGTKLRSASGALEGLDEVMLAANLGSLRVALAAGDMKLARTRLSDLKSVEVPERPAVLALTGEFSAALACKEPLAPHHRARAPAASVARGSIKRLPQP